MKKINFIAATSFLVLAFAFSAFGQTTPAGPAVPAKVYIINTEAFYAEKEGIGKLTSALIALNKEFEPKAKELETINTRIETLAKEITALQTQLNNAATAKPAVVNVEKIQNDITTKSEEGTRLQTEIKRKQEDYKQAAERREAALLSPIKREIGNALVEYSKSKGYSLVLDISKMIETGQVLYLDPATDITPEFIKFFNAKPATTASTTRP